jgi:DNA-binding MarR family transcriptional regulator
MPRRGRSDKSAQGGKAVDVAAMRALAHPLRWALMDALLVEDTATATRCAELVGASQATCSFHLRQLARYGFVEQVESSDRRERPWRMATTEQRWDRVQPDETRARAATELTRVFVEREFDKFRRWLRSALSYPKDWQSAAGHVGAQTWLTADELTDLSKQLREVMTRYKDRLDDPGRRPEGSRPVRLFLMSYPLPEDAA